MAVFWLKMAVFGSKWPYFSSKWPYFSSKWPYFLASIEPFCLYLAIIWPVLSHFACIWPLFGQYWASIGGIGPVLAVLALYWRYWPCTGPCTGTPGPVPVPMPVYRYPCPYPHTHGHTPYPGTPYPPYPIPTATWLLPVPGSACTSGSPGFFCFEHKVPYRHYHGHIQNRVKKWQFQRCISSRFWQKCCFLPLFGCFGHILTVLANIGQTSRLTVHSLGVRVYKCLRMS